jgi:hypothetical protein
MKRSAYLLHPVSCVLFLASCILLLVALSPCPPVSAQTTRIIFLHHSCGQNLINEGGVREGLTGLGYEFYDHGYNEEGLRAADGSHTGRNFDVPGDNTDPDGIAEIFRQPLHDPPDNTFSRLMQYDVIAFKSCFPTSNIHSDDHLAELKSYYLSVRDRMDEYPDKLFIVVTQPPQVPGASDQDEARRARALADWLKSDEFAASLTGGHANVLTFDFFGLLAGSDNFLRPEYRYNDDDAHPNERANRDIGPLFVDFIDEAIRSHYGGGLPPRPAATAAPGAEATEPPPVIAPLAEGVVDDFESGVDAWYVDTGEGAETECEADAGAAHGGAASLRMQYDVPSEGWGGCGRSFDARQDWSGADGLSLWLRADGASRWVTLVVFAGDSDDPTPFEVGLEVGANWEQFALQWADFVKAEWVGDTGLPAFDPAQVTSYALYADEGDAGTIWVDDVALVAGEASPPVIAPAPGEPAAPTEEPGEDDQSGSICGGAIVLPIGALGVFLVARRRRG